MRVELRDGQWAELREHISHAQDKEIIRARRLVNEGGDILDAYVPAMIRMFVREWHVDNPDDGKPVGLDDPDALDRAPRDVIDVLFAHAVERYKATTVPNAPTPPSSDS